MLYFPQLASGAVTQFPCQKRVRQRTLVNRLADGTEVKLLDPGAGRVEWQIHLAALTSAEWNAIAGLFGAVGGQLGSFVFLDPFGNLLRWSEDLSAAVWARDAGLMLSAGAADPMGGTGATRIANAAGGDQSLAQAPAVPARYRYSLSVWARSDTAEQVTLFGSAGPESAQRIFDLGPTWTRLELGTQFTALQETTTFGVKVPGGVNVELFGFQVEPQMGASSYKASCAQSGVYANASFLDDVLAMTSEAPGIFSCPVRVGAKG